MNKRMILRKSTAIIVAVAVASSGMQWDGEIAKAATLAFDDENSSVMLDAGGYKKEVYGVGTDDWAVTYVDRNDTLPPAKTYLTDNYRETVGTVPTSDWASSVVFDQYSEALYAHPLAYRAASNGMQMASPAVVDTTSYVDGEPSVSSLLDDTSVELVVGGNGFTAKDASVDVTTDWTYEIVMENTAGTSSMRATLAKGTPYAYYEFNNVTPTISLGAGATNLAIFKNSTSSNIIGVSLTNKTDGKVHYYIISAASGTTWTNAGGKLTANMTANAKYMSIAILPNNSNEAFDLYAEYAFNFITNTTVEWEYLENSSKVVTRYNVETTNMQTGAVGGDTIIALYPHQWRYADETYTGYTYDTIRGTMKTIVGSSYVTQMTYNGVLTTLPVTSDETYIGTIKDQLGYLYDYRKNKGDPKWIAFLEGQYGGYDTYWVGKNLNTLSDAILIANQFEDEDMQTMTQEMAEGMANYIEFWFDPFQAYQSGNFVDDYFYYHEEYGTLIGYPTSYGSDYEVNDHHFHYGYWIKAAATIAIVNPEWAQEWGGMVYEMISDIANCNRDGSSYNENSPARYPFLRNFDIYEGHSWASGVANYEYDANGNLIDAKGGLAGGNNQESSSEATNAWASLIMWGEVMGNTTIRDLGIYMYTTEIAAIEDYYYDVHDEIFTEEYEDKDYYDVQTVTRLFGGRYDHTAWWTENSIEVTTILMLPIGAASLYLGKYPQKVKAVVESISESSVQWKQFLAKKDQSCTNFGKVDMLVDPETNQDIIAEYYALYDPAEALNMYDISDSGFVENGESRAHTLEFISSLNEYGTQNYKITASSPYAVVLEKNGVKTYVVENHTDEEQTVYFSDGAYVEVAANSSYSGAKTGNAENPEEDDSEIVGSKQKFTLETYLENMDGTGYDMTSKVSNAKSDTDIFTYEPKEISGFTFDVDNANNVLTVNVAEGNLETVKVYYSRNSYTVKYVLNGATSSSNNPTEYKYGSSHILEEPEKEGYTFIGWYLEPEFFTQITAITESTTGDMTLYAKFVANELISTYTVEYYLQSEDKTGYNIVEEDTQVITEYIGTVVAPTPKKYPGYTLNENSVTYGEVLMNGALVIRFFYNYGSSGSSVDNTTEWGDRGVYVDETNKATLYVGDAGDVGMIIAYYKIYNNENAANAEYNNIVTTNGAGVPGYYMDEGDRFTTDLGSVSDEQYIIYKFNINNKEFTEWTITSFGEIKKMQQANASAEYLVRHFKQKENMLGYEEVYSDRQSYSSKKGFAIVAEQMNYEGFSVNKDKSRFTAVVSENSDTVINIYYDRNEYPIIYENLEGARNTNAESYIYGIGMDLLEPVRKGYEFYGWYLDGEFSNSIQTIDETTSGVVNLYAAWADEPTTITVEINGFQISSLAEGMRTVYSVEEQIDGKDVVEAGLVYGLADYASKEDMVVGSSNDYVADFAGTTEGINVTSYSESATATTYTMTMKFAAKNAAEFSANWYVRAYAKLEDGSYVYTDVIDYTIYDIANVLYKNKLMTTYERHNYLYTDILLKVNENYEEVDFIWNGTVVPMNKAK